LVFLLSLQVITDSDFGWHLRAGDYILENLSIPKTDIFSFSQPHYPYVYHSWLSEVLISIFHGSLGLYGASILFASVLTLGIFVLYKTAGIFTRNTSFLFFLWLTPLAHSVAGGRTRVFGFLFLSILYFLFVKYSKHGSKIIFLTPFLFLCWVNFHASFILGILTLAILLVAGLLSESRQKITKILWIFPVSVFATIINPYHIKAWHQAILMSQNSYGIKDINLDWQPLVNPNSTGWIFAFFAASLLLAIKILKVNADKLSQIFLAIFFLFSMVTSRFTIALLVFFAPVAEQFISSFKNKLKKETQSALPVKTSLAALLLVLLLLAFKNLAELKIAYKSYASYSTFLKTKSPNRFSHATWPYKANEVVRQNLRGKNILNDANWGGFMLLLDKNQKVFYYGAMDNFVIDGRSFAVEYLNLTNTLPGFENLLEKYGINAVFLPKNYLLVSYLKADNAWETVYTDTETAVMVKR
jgi:hypothetical protein